MLQSIRNWDIRITSVMALAMSLLSLALGYTSDAAVTPRPARFLAAPTVDMPIVSSATIRVGESTTLTITCKITSVPPDPAVIPNQVKLLRLDSMGEVIASLGRMQDDGTGTNTFTISVSFTESVPGRVDLRVSAAFRGRLKQVFSPITSFTVTAEPLSVTFIQPSSGPSGTLVIVHGAGFLPNDRVTFESASAAPTIFLNSNQLATRVPLASEATPLPAHGHGHARRHQHRVPLANEATPLPAGPRQLLINGIPVQTFTVTSLPANPHPPGIVLQETVTTLAQRFSANRPQIALTISQLRSMTTDVNARTYLHALEQLVLPENT